MTTIAADLLHPLERATELTVYLVGSRYGHHARHSGYEGFSRYVGTGLKSPFRFRFLKFKHFPLLGWRIDSAVARFMDRDCYSLGLFLNEMTTAVHAMIHRGAIYHFIYGDTDICWLGRLRSASGFKVIATFHEADEGLEYLRIDQRITDHLDAVFLVSESQRQYFEKYMPAERVMVIPHGIDTKFFQPSHSVQREPMCLVVGGHLRDFNTLSGAIDVVSRAQPHVRFVAVGVNHGHEGPRFNHPAVEFLEGISDEDLRLLYQQASVTLISLRQASANNCLLESMACGTPVVATDVGGVREYLGDGGLVSARYDADEMAAQAMRILSDRTLADELSHRARARVLQYDYRTIAARQREAYSLVEKLPARAL